MAINTGLLHDGLVRDEKVLFTVVDGRIAVYDLGKGAIEDIIDLNAILGTAEGRPLGWCRGLEILPDNRIVVGFSRLCYTKFRESLIWLKERVTQLGPGNWHPGIRYPPMLLASISNGVYWSGTSIWSLME